MTLVIQGIQGTFVPMSKVSDIAGAFQPLLVANQAAEVVAADRAMKQARAISDRFAAARRARIRELRASGWSIKRIAELLGVTHEAVRLALKPREGQ